MKKRKGLHLIAYLVGVAMLLTAFTFCGKQAEKKLEIFSWWTAGGEAEGLAEMFKIYSNENPGIEIINATVAGGAGQNAKAVLASRMQGGNPPDSFQVHAGHELIDSWVAAGKMEPIDFIFSNIMESYPKGVIDIISSKGHIYSVPVNIHRANVLWYNKKLFKKYGLKAPDSLDEFFTVAQKLKAKGVTPLALGDQGIWSSVQLLETVLIAKIGANGYKGLWIGDTAWDSAGVKDAIKTFIKILGYVNNNHNALSWDGAAQLVIDGSCAMTIMGDWAEGYFKAKNQTPDVDFGWAPSPGTKGSFDALSDTFGLPIGAPHRANAVKWLTVCASKEGQDAFNPKKGSIPSRIDGDKSLYDVYLQSAMADFSANDIVPSLAHGAAASPSWLTMISDAVTLLVTDKDADKADASFVDAAKKSLKM
jgi:glucose/mannose transport system substrate-binding protein